MSAAGAVNHRACSRAAGDRACGAKIARRIGGEFRTAAGAAEEIGRAAVVEAVLGGGRIDSHAADRVPRQRLFGEAHRSCPLWMVAARHKPSHHGKVKIGILGAGMNIGAAAAKSGVSAKMIRHYEAIGLLRPAERRGNAYRDYGERDVDELKFIKRARRLGFSTPEIAALLELWRDRSRPSRDVKGIAEAHICDLEGRVADMQAMAKTLGKLVAACHGDDRPDCPILDDLALGDAGA